PDASDPEEPANAGDRSGRDRAVPHSVEAGSRACHHIRRLLPTFKDNSNQRMSRGPTACPAVNSRVAPLLPDRQLPAAFKSPTVRLGIGLQGALRETYERRSRRDKAPGPLPDDKAAWLEQREERQLGWGGCIRPTLCKLFPPAEQQKAVVLRY